MHRPGAVTRIRVRQVSGSAVRDRRDDLATEEPLEIRLLAGGESRTVAITMRTPGADFELAAGFLYGEGVIGPGDIAAIGYCTDEDLAPEERYNTVTVRLSLPVLPDITTLERHFLTSSACGVCGTATLAALRDRCPAPMTGPAPAAPALTVAPRILYGLPHLLRKAQSGFGRTGGLHAAGLFTPDGTPVGTREDVGRHNAVDKLVGSALLAGRLPFDRHILLVSGRASYEIMQKAVTAGVQIVCAVSAPSSLAVNVAREFGVTLVGFLREERFNIYSGAERITTGDDA
ncbi:formate dehydrogenase accessory sulfurtransferase FdhD [Sphaerimonospora sp. CA-214678]|uniref:formate dehydrogenase accessory sulfurtransferase FdhD n=1 Tax=Sphaerimonospora sp. CA-214678 TaxID=3240029 RepID=UPI003D90F4B0